MPQASGGLGQGKDESFAPVILSFEFLWGSKSMLDTLSLFSRFYMRRAAAAEGKGDRGFLHFRKISVYPRIIHDLVQDGTVATKV